MTEFNINKHPHRRYNPLLDEWVLVSPQRTQRPWQGQQEKTEQNSLPEYDPSCYLCPGNKRSNGEINENYSQTYVFDNDFPALGREEVLFEDSKNQLFQTAPEQGENRVICFSPKHNLTLPELEVSEIVEVIHLWKSQYEELGAKPNIKHVQIFENKGAVMGCSNPHPHCQIWAQSSIPTLVSKTQKQLENYFQKHQKSLLEEYVVQELEKKERVVLENQDFVALVPFWATWPYETMILPKKKKINLSELSDSEILSYAEILKKLTIKYDNLFETSFPYSAGIHQAPTDGLAHPGWHFHHHFYPPLLRSAEVKKFMVGYEMLAEPQRDITPEQSAEILRNLSEVHYKTVD